MSRVLDALARHAVDKPAAIALSTRSLSLTYAELEAEIQRAATALFAFAPLIRPGAPVAVRLANGPAWVVLDLALMRLGWPSLPLPGFFTPAQREHALADAGAALVVEEGGLSRSRSWERRSPSPPSRRRP